MANGYYGQQNQNVMPGQQWPGYPQVPQQQRQPDVGMIWIESEDEVSGYPVAPNVAVALWDKHKPYVYLKSADQFGMPSYRRIKYVVEGEQSTNPIANTTATPDMSRYVDKDAFDSLATEVRNLRNRLDDATPIHFPDEVSKK